MGILSYEATLSEGLAGLEWSLEVVFRNSSMLCLHFRILWAAADILPPALPWFPEAHAAQQFLQCGSFLRGLPGPHIHGPGWLWCFPQSLLNSLGHYRCVGVCDLEAWADWRERPGGFPVTHWTRLDPARDHIKSCWIYLRNLSPLHLPLQPRFPDPSPGAITSLPDCGNKQPPNKSL